MKLTKAQQDMLATCLAHEMAWCTSADSPNHTLLREWEAKGWAEEVDAPAEILVAYQITPAGRLALEEAERG